MDLLPSCAAIIPAQRGNRLEPPLKLTIHHSLTRILLGLSLKTVTLPAQIQSLSLYYTIHHITISHPLKTQNPQLICPYLISKTLYRLLPLLKP